MPIEIRELIIKATVDSSNTGTGHAPSSGSGSSGTANETIIKECVDKVLAILKEKNER